MSGVPPQNAKHALTTAVLLPSCDFMQDAMIRLRVSSRHVFDGFTPPTSFQYSNTSPSDAKNDSVTPSPLSVSGNTISGYGHRLTYKGAGAPFEEIHRWTPLSASVPPVMKFYLVRLYPVPSTALFTHISTFWNKYELFPLQLQSAQGCLKSSNVLLAATLRK